MKHLRPLLLALLCAAFVVPATASAWTPIDSSRPVWPTTYSWQLNQNGSSAISFGEVERILQTSYETWTNPACSAYRYRYNSTTSRTSTGNGDEQNVHGFLSSWPGEYGDPNSVIGITVNLTSAGGGAPRIFESDVSFNEDTWQFVDRSPSRWNEADLQSIATHEYGHSLGLGHSSTGAATMYGAYDGGSGARSLHSDDIDGVCTLYPSGISGDDDDDDDDSTPSGDCLICEPCTSPEQCGPNGICAQFDPNGGAVCTELCPSGSCPGAAVCVLFADASGGEFPLCVNEQAETRGICPGDWDCENGFGTSGDDDDDSTPTGDDDDATGDDDDDASGDDDDDEDDERRGCRCSASPVQAPDGGLMLLGLLGGLVFRRRR